LPDGDSRDSSDRRGTSVSSKFQKIVLALVADGWSLLDKHSVMAGLVPAIHALDCKLGKTWMPATSAGMTMERYMAPKRFPSVPAQTEIQHWIPAFARTNGLY